MIRKRRDPPADPFAAPSRAGAVVHDAASSPKRSHQSMQLKQKDTLCKAWHQR